ncbi:hypothetical protein [Streptomyces sp. NPDC058295]|uniref:hypothetical protein n=1 Tax=Streptomyces sp. NPDC058295 TaxID=3346431 RepID=UPI0036E6C3A9
MTSSRRVKWVGWWCRDCTAVTAWCAVARWVGIEADSSTAAGLASCSETRYAQRGKTVEITGLNEPSAHLHGKLSGELSVGH